MTHGELVAEYTNLLERNSYLEKENKKNEETVGLLRNSD